MFRKLFGKDKAPDPEPESPELRALKDVIARERPNDPLIGPKVGADKIQNWVMGAVETERGVHVESLFVALGALAGFACQMSARRLLQDGGHPDFGTPWAEVGGADGRTYHFGDAINYELLEAPMSLFAVSAGIIAKISEQPVPDMVPIVRHVAETVGGGAFGTIRFPEGTAAGDTPINYLIHFWHVVPEIAYPLGIDEREWPTLFGIAAQNCLSMAREVIAPTVALTLFMESAIAMAKVDPRDMGLSHH